MRRFVIALLAGSSFALAGGQMASAADLAVRGPVYKAPVTVAPSWAGPYIGLGLGGRWGTTTWTTTQADSVAPQPIDASSPHDFDNDSIHVSGYLGYNFQFGNWVAGIEADIGWGSSDETLSGIPGTIIGFGPPAQDLSSVKLTWDGSVRLRVGALITPSVLLYATGGWAFQKVESAASCTTTTGWCNGVTAQATSIDDIESGWTLGGGAEAMLGSDWLVRIEYRYSDFGTRSNTYLTVPQDLISADLDTTTHIVRLGIARKLGGM